MSPKRTFYMASPDDILSGKVTDVYFDRTCEILKHENDRTHVTMECAAKGFPESYQWAVFAGLDEVVTLLEGKEVSLWSIPEGTLFRPNEPVLLLEGEYLKFGSLETSILGMICQASGIATKTARCKLATQGRPLYSFGVRRMHPAIAPMIDRSAYIGGCDGVAAVKSAEKIGLNPVGTIPHTLILIKGDTIESSKAFDDIIDKAVPRVALIDTFNDEKFEAIRIAEEMGDRIQAIRLDTPSSRRGNFLELFQEVRWELDMRGFEHIKLFASGGLDEYSIYELNEAVDAYGIGTSVSSAPVLDFALDIVDIDGKPLAKRGKKSGRKMLWEGKNWRDRHILPAKSKAEKNYKPLLKKIIDNGKVVAELPDVNEIRETVLKHLEHVDFERDVLLG